MRLECGEAVEYGVETDIAGDASQSDRFDHRADVVDDQAGHRSVALRRHHHPEQSAHRRTDPGNSLDIRVREHGGQRREIGRENVVGGIGQPFTVAAAGDVGAKQAEAIGERRRQRIEITPVAREAVHTDNDARTRRMAPFPVRDAVKAVCAQAAESFLAWLDHEPAARVRE